MALKRFEYSQNGTKNPPERDGANELCWKARGYKVILGKANFSSSTTGRILITCFFFFVVHNKLTVPSFHLRC